MTLPIVSLVAHPELCAGCNARRLEAAVEGELGFIVCSVCMERHPQVSDVEAARKAAWRAAMAMSMNQRNAAAAASTAAQLKVIRDLLSAKLAGGEAEFWDLVERELLK